MRVFVGGSSERTKSSPAGAREGERRGGAGCSSPTRQDSCWMDDIPVLPPLHTSFMGERRRGEHSHPRTTHTHRVLGNQRATRQRHAGLSLGCTQRREGMTTTGLTHITTTTAAAALLSMLRSGDATTTRESRWSLPLGGQICFSRKRDR